MISNDHNHTNLIKRTIIYAIGNFGTKILSFLIVPLYTYYISTNDMGDYDLLNSTINLLIPLITLQVFDAAFRWMIRGDDINGDYAKASLQIVFINSLIASILIYVISCIKPFAYSMDFIWLLFTSCILTAIQKLLRGLNNQKLFVYSSMVYTVIFLVLNLVQICILKMGVKSLFVSSTLANVFAILFCITLEKELRINYLSKLNFNVINNMLKFSAPLIPNQLNWWVMSSSNRYIIRFFLGASANGVFAIANKFPSILQMLLGFFNTSWQDVSVADKSNDTGNYYSFVFKNLYRFSFSLLYFLIPITKLFIMLIMSNEYKIAATYTSFLYLGTVFQSFSSFYGVGYLREKDTKKASLTSIYGAIASALCNILLVKFIGLQAASFSTFIGFLLMWLVREKQNKISLSITINKKDFMKYFVPAIMISIIECFDILIIDIVCVCIGLFVFVICNWTILINIVMRFKQKMNY